MKYLICLTGLILVCSSAALADIARPDKTPNHVPKPKTEPGIVTTMDIRLDRDAKEARLIIPKSQIKQLRAELEQLDGDSDDVASVATAGISRTQTIASGLFLSLAILFGGMWFVKSGKAATRAGKSAVIVAIVATVVSAATFVYANAGPPAEARSITGKMFAQAVHFYGVGWGQVRLETGTEDHIKLIVPDPQPSE